LFPFIHFNLICNHFRLVEAQDQSQWAPLLLWLNGGPGCSSLGGFFTEHGPFHPSSDGLSLVENVHSWNKAANVLYLESPHDIGFSYRDSKTYGQDNYYNDDKTANDNAIALKEFFQRFPEYQNRDFYITGESYGGVYVPTLTNLIIKMIQNGTLPNVKLVGMAVGNGELSVQQQTNSAVDLLYYRGMLGFE
ncbi:serine carboxypeptidase, partial [Oesophagostomum dentatum]